MQQIRWYRSYRKRVEWIELKVTAIVSFKFNCSSFLEVVAAVAVAVGYIGHMCERWNVCAYFVFIISVILPSSTATRGTSPEMTDVFN